MVHQSSFSEVLCNRVVPQKSMKDSCKDDEIAADTRFRHRNPESKMPLGNNVQQLEIESS